MNIVQVQSNISETNNIFCNYLIKKRNISKTKILKKMCYHIMRLFN